MPRFGDLFGSPMELNLPQAKSLSVSKIQPTPQMPIPAPSMPMEMPQPQAARGAPASELDGIMTGVNMLARQWKNNVDEKLGPAGTIKNFGDQLATLQADRLRLMDMVANRQKSGAAPTDMDDYMRRNAQFESANNNDATNPGSGAAGIYQFLPSTWKWIAREAPELGLTEEGIRDRDQQTKAMRYYTNKSVRTLEPILGRKPTGGELYLSHLLGHSGGPAVLADLDAPLTQTISDGAYKGNPFLSQYKTGRELVDGLNKTFGGG